MGQLLIGQIVSYLVTAVCGAALGLVASKFAGVRQALGSIDELTIMVCRLVIYNDKFSVDEKVDAYRTYRGRGGNSKTKHYMDELLGEDADDYLAHHV